jgi:hypothetical protein
MFGIAAGIMVLVWIAVYKMLPDLKPNFKGTYGELMKSVFHLAKHSPFCDWLLSVELWLSDRCVHYLQPGFPYGKTSFQCGIIGGWKF